MKNSRYIIIVAVAAAVVLFLSGVIGYMIGKNRGENAAELRIEELEAQIADLKKVQDVAIVTKRVSEQMEDIAYQQKTIAEMQLDTANAQKALAEAARDRAQAAEIEANRQSRLATEAKNKADEMRDIAEKEKAEADAARDVAKQQLAQNDTLTQRMQGSIWGTRAFTQSSGTDEKDKNADMLLAYSSWNLLKNYEGNTYFSDTFKALSLYSNSTSDYDMNSRSAVTAVAMVPGRDDRCVAVTDYGEIAVCSDDETRILLKHSIVSNNNFRAVVAKEDNVFAMNLNGQVLKVGYDGQKKLLSNPLQGKYFAMVEMPGGKLVLAKEKGLDIIDEETLSPIKAIATDYPISCIYMGRDSLCVQFDNNGVPEYAELSTDGILHQKEKTQYDGVVTAGFYDRETGLTLLGTKNGITQIYNRWKHYMTEVPGQKSSITSITVQDTIAVICSYDHTVQICNMPMFEMYNNWSFKDYMDMEVEPTAKGNCSHEWITPVIYTLEGWPLSVCGNKKSMDVFIGTSNGKVEKMNISVDMMARRLKDIMDKRGLHEAVK